MLAQRMTENHSRFIGLSENLSGKDIVFRQKLDYLVKEWVLSGRTLLNWQGWFAFYYLTLFLVY